MHGTGWHGDYERLHCQPNCLPPPPLHPHQDRHFQAGFEAPQWIHCDEAGNVKLVPADRQRLVQELNVPFRDLRMLDPSLRIPYPTSIFVRASAIIVNFESIRLVIAHDRVLVLSVPVPEQGLLHGMPARQDSPFVKHLVERVRPSGCGNGNGKERHFDASLPFELRCLEAALDGAISVMDIETITLEQHASPTLLRMAHKVTRSQLEELRDLRSDLSKLTSRVSKLKQELETVVASEGEMRMMTLGRRHQAAQRRASEEGAPADAPPRGVMPCVGSGADRRGSSGSGGVASGAAGGAQSDDDGNDSQGCTPQEAWHRSFDRVSIMLQTMKSMQGPTLQEHSDTWHVANLLDSNLMTVDHLVQRLQILRDKVQSTEKFIDAELDHRRNELVSLDIFVTAITMGFSFVACVGGVFGMNLTNGNEGSHIMFLVATWGSVSVAFAMFAAIIAFAYKRHLLLLPEAKPAAQPR